MYDLCATLARASGPERLAVVEAIEETGNVVFTLTAQLADAVRKKSGEALKYLGSFHTNLESGHMQNGDQQQLMRVQLEPASTSAASRWWTKSSTASPPGRRKACAT